MRIRSHIPAIFVLIALSPFLGSSARAGEGAAVSPSIEQVFPLRKHLKTLQPVVREKVEYYEIKGTCEADLQFQLKEKGCGWSDGKVYDSMTTWEFKWDYDYVRAPASCSVASFKVSVDIVFRYPKWMKDEFAPQTLIEKWDSYMQGLVTHESGHRDMAVAAAQELSSAVEALPPFPDCDQLDRMIRKLCRDHTEQLGREAEVYDEATSHGGAQGAVLE